MTPGRDDDDRPREKLSWREIDRRVRATAKTLELEHLLDRRPRELSGGQRQRVAMGRAIVRNPKVFLFDEPLSNLDAKLREQMRVELVRLQREVGITSIYVTHDQAEALVMSDRVVVMADGAIQQIGDPQTIYARPANRFVAKFIGVANLVDGVLLESNGSTCAIEVRVGPDCAPLRLKAGWRISSGRRASRVRWMRRSDATGSAWTATSSSAPLPQTPQEELV